MNFDAQLSNELGRFAANFPEWADVRPGLPAKFSVEAHGDAAQWREAIEDLEEPHLRESSLRRLMPWRKGPWTFGETHIDTEWRSDWKWERLKPHLPSLDHQRVLDVGCGNGYFGWRLLDAGARAVVGIDPTLLYCMQHLAAARMLGEANHWVLPLTLEASPLAACFDTVLSMGVIYHRKEPVDHVARLFACCRPGGTVVLESLIVEGTISLHPPNRYARMRNVSIVPSIEQLKSWLRDAGFESPRVVDITPTLTDEQHTTDWMRFESLREALDPHDASKTVEGHPAPIRATVIANKARAKP